jgi:hypothetical protein
MRNVVVLTVVLVGCTPNAADKSASQAADTAFTSMQTRGAMVMGVDQYTSAHVFEDLPDGGRVVLERDDPSDTAAIATIRAHMRDIAASFKQGDFLKPFKVHAGPVPGVPEMVQRKSAITYEVIDLRRGGEVRITSRDPVAIRAIHDFLGFQRTAHHAGSHQERSPK